MNNILGAARLIHLGIGGKSPGVSSSKKFSAKLAYFNVSDILNNG